MKYKISFLLLLFSILSCKQKEPNEKNVIRLYAGYGVVVDLARSCVTEIRMYKGYEHVLQIYSAANSGLSFKPSITSTEDDTLHKRLFTENELQKGDSIYFEFREDYENLGRCIVEQGLPIYPPNVFVTKVQVLD
jgi:hypothetical protein